jgi:peptidoglycan/xylan/chitin deacetylase (PgdA/CDA1 family)
MSKKLCVLMSIMVVLVVYAVIGSTYVKATDSANSAVTQTPTPTLVLPLVKISTRVPTEALTITPTPEFTFRRPGPIVCPILLYHSLEDTHNDDPYVSKYIVDANQFAEEMKAIYDLGYKTITATKLADVIRYGGYLPNKPIIITFDDGYDDVNLVAYPIMEQYGFVGVTYVIVKGIDTPGFHSLEQLQELIDHGWEIGNHTYSHPFLTKIDELFPEIVDSKTSLEKLINTKVNSFAYPYADTNANITIGVSKYYTSAMGVESFVVQENLYYLNRLAIFRNTDIAVFIGHLSP